MCLAVPGRVVAVAGGELTRTADVDFGGLMRKVSLALVPEVVVGDYVVVHVGLAIARLDQAEAEATLAELRRLAEALEPGDR
jgi:hydrogenase expression/formation protein HypC